MKTSEIQIGAEYALAGRSIKGTLDSLGGLVARRVRVLETGVLMDGTGRELTAERLQRNPHLKHLAQKSGVRVLYLDATTGRDVTKVIASRYITATWGEYLRVSAEYRARQQERREARAAKQALEDAIKARAAALGMKVRPHSCGPTWEELVPLLDRLETLIRLTGGEVGA